MTGNKPVNILGRIRPRKVANKLHFFSARRKSIFVPRRSIAPSPTFSIEHVLLSNEVHSANKSLSYTYDIKNDRLNQLT